MDPDYIALARKAYGGFEAAALRGQRNVADYLAYFNMLADDVAVRYTVPYGTPMSGEFHGKKAVVDLTTKIAPRLIDGITLDQPLDFLSRGPRVVVVGSESYTIRATGVRAQNKNFAVILDFEGELIKSSLQIKDMSELVAACQAEPVGGRIRA
jgi:ketosteroid isomerase-like protein